MPALPTKNLSNPSWSVWLPVKPLAATAIIDGVEHIVCCLEFTHSDKPLWRCRIKDWRGPFRPRRTEAARDMHDAIKRHMRGRPWTYVGPQQIHAVA